MSWTLIPEGLIQKTRKIEANWVELRFHRTDSAIDDNRASNALILALLVTGDIRFGSSPLIFTQRVGHSV